MSIYEQAMKLLTRIESDMFEKAEGLSLIQTIDLNTIGVNYNLDRTQTEICLNYLIQNKYISYYPADKRLEGDERTVQMTNEGIDKVGEWLHPKR